MKKGTRKNCSPLRAQKRELWKLTTGNDIIDTQSQSYLLLRNQITFILLQQIDILGEERGGSEDQDATRRTRPSFYSCAVRTGNTYATRLAPRRTKPVDKSNTSSFHCEILYIFPNSYLYL